MPQPDALRTAALSALAAGISIIPCGTDKRPIISSWAIYQQQRSSVEMASLWLDAGDCQAFAGIGGAVSGNLLILDFDLPDFYEQWLGAVGELSHLLVVQETHSGREQVWFRCASPVGGNEKLAWAPADNAMGREIAIETRGEGGYAVMAPSIGPSGKRYELVVGSWDKLPVVSDARRDALLDAARRLCKAPFTKQERERASKAKLKAPVVRVDGDSVIDTFNRTNALKDVLQSCGYTPAFAGRWNRPGGETAGVILTPDERHSFHFSSNDPLCDSHRHDAFSVWCHYKHGGDVKAAVRAASAELGMNKPSPSPTKPASQIVVASEPRQALREMIADTASGKRRCVPFKGDKLTRMTNALLPSTATVVCGRPGSGKSFFILDECWFWHSNAERFAVKMLEKNHAWHMQRVLAQISGESKLLDPRWTFENGELALSIHDQHADLLKEFGGSIWDSEDDDGMDDLIRWVEARADEGCRVIVIDPVTKANGQTSQPWLDDKKFVNDLERIQKRHNVSTVLVSHPKGGQKTDDPLDSIAGGKAYSRFTDTVLVLSSFKSTPKAKRVKPYAGLEHSAWVTRSICLAKTREGVGDGLEIAVEFDPATLRFRELGVVVGDAEEGDMPVSPKPVFA
jgi:hypothetical protein